MDNQLTNALRNFIVVNEGNALDIMKRKLYDASLIETRGNVTAAAKLLGVSRSALNNYANNWSGKRPE